MRWGNFKEVSAWGYRYMDMVMVHGHGTRRSLRKLACSPLPVPPVACSGLVARHQILLTGRETLRSLVVCFIASFWLFRAFGTIGRPAMTYVDRGGRAVPPDRFSIKFKLRIPNDLGLSIIPWR